MKRFHEDFSTLLNGFNLETLENDPNSIYGLSKDLALNYMNPAWFKFARENEGEPEITEKYILGTHFGDCMTGPVKDYYLEVFQSILQADKVWHHDYECSSPEKFRIYHQSVYPLYNRSGLIIINCLVNDQPHDANSKKSCLPIKKLYIQKTGLITQCSNCRRVQRASQPDIWDWVPAWVKRMPKNTSHSFCQVCFEFYYKFRL